MLLKGVPFTLISIIGVADQLTEVNWWLEDRRPASS